MRMQLNPGNLSGTLPSIPSKSDAHRLLICAALADTPTSIRMEDKCGEDIDATIRCLRSLGASIERDEDALHVTPVGILPHSPVLDCGESGSTLRFLLPVVAALGCGGVFTGAGRLPERPIEPLLDALRLGGVSFDGDRLPLRMERATLRPGCYVLPGDVSSQFITGLLLALARLSGGGRIELERPLESAGYVDMTVGALSRFSVRAEKIDHAFDILPGQAYRSPGRAAVEGDWSNMAFFLAAGALGGPIVCTGLPEHSAQGDAAIVPILRRFGAQIEPDGGVVTVSKGGGAHDPAREIDVRAIPDLLPILAVVAALTPGSTRFEGAARLRLKESDRLKTVADMLRALGGVAEEGADFLNVVGVPRLKGGCAVDCAGDHRIAMAAAIAASACREPVLLHGAEAIDKSYPSFYEDYRKLGGDCHVVDDR